MASFSDKKYLGVDIGTALLKVVELTPADGRGELRTYGAMELPVDLVRSDSREDHILVASTLKEIMRQCGASAKQAATALPGFLVFTSVIDLPAMPEKEVSAAVKWEAQKYIPAPLSDLVLDWKVTGYTGQGAGDRETPPGIQVLLTAAPKDLVKKYLEIFRLAGLDLLGMETEIFALTRSLIGYHSAPAMLIDMGATATDLNIIVQGVPVIARNVDIGGQAVTRAIAQGLNIELSRAEQFKRDFGLATGEVAGSLPEIIKPVINLLTDEIKKTQELHRHKYGQALSQVILSGGATKLPGLAAYWQNILHLEVTAGDPWRYINVRPDLKTALTKSSSGYEVAAGLALKPIIESAETRRNK